MHAGEAPRAGPGRKEIQMTDPAHAPSPARDRRTRPPIPAHFGSLAALLEAVREHGDGACPIRCAARYIELPAPQSPATLQGVWGVLVTARLACVAGRGEATLSAWIVAEELPRHAATAPRREAARARLTDLHAAVLAQIEACGFAGESGQYPVPPTAFLCRAHVCPVPADTPPDQSLRLVGVAIPLHGVPASGTD
jgi:hypothetical protein